MPNILCKFVRSNFCNEKIEFISYLDALGLNRIRVRLVTENGDLQDVMFQYETFIADEWAAIVRYDCAHGFFHRDILYPNGDKEKHTIEIDTLKRAAQYAEQDLKDRWEWYCERYIKKTQTAIIMTNKETIERNIGLTFDFVNHLIDNRSDLEKLPDNFTVEFVEKDFPKLQRRQQVNQIMPNFKRRYVQVRNSFVTV